MIRKGLLIVLFFLIGAVSLSSFPISKVDKYQISHPLKKVYIRRDKPLSQQIKDSTTVYIIKNVIDLRGETVVIPNNSILLFKKRGKIRNGIITGKFTIEAPSKQLFDNVDISCIECPIKFSWIIGNRKEVSNKDFQNLPNAKIDFENVNYTALDNISLDNLPGLYFENFNLTTGHSIHYRQSSLINGKCAPYGAKATYEGKIRIAEVLPEPCDAYMIEITTADETKYDSRPNEQGIPTLYKGITSRIIKNEKGVISITDSLEFFSRERIYNGHKVESSYRIYKPRTFILSNCHFTFPNKSGISLRGCDFLIDNCVFEATEGSNSIVSLGGHNGVVRNSVVRGAYYLETHTSYGIQVVKGTGISIENCKFYENRRSVDFSGGYESRYNVVKNCFFYQEKNEGKTGSAIGGHSTSFGNVFKNNMIYGDYQVGIQCRGENEIIDGNTFNCTAATMISFAYNTTIINNKVISPSKYAVNVFAGSGIQVEGNSLHIYNNEIEVRRVLVNGDSNIKYTIKNNTIKYKPNAASIETVIFSQKPKLFEINDNDISNSRSDTRIKLNANGEILQYKK